MSLQLAIEEKHLLCFFPKLASVVYAWLNQKSKKKYGAT
jgi:hypothetical protein